MEGLMIVDNVTNSTCDNVSHQATATEDKLFVALGTILKQSKGYPQLTLDPSFQCLHALTEPKVPSLNTCISGVYWISKEYVSKQLLQALTVQPEGLPGQYIPSTKLSYNHSAKKDYIGLPRFLGLSVYGLASQDKRRTCTSVPVCNLSLRPLQQQCIQQTTKTLQEWGGATIVADCGFGKTRLSLGLINALQQRTLVLCNREVLMKQWSEVFQEFTPWTLSWLKGLQSVIRPTKGAKVSSAAKSSDAIHTCTDAWDLSTHVCIASIDTLIEVTESEFLQSFGLVIVDEMHHIAASTLVHALPRLPCKYVVGLTATPERRDGLEHVLYWLAGPVSFVYQRLPSITGLQHTVQVYKVIPQGTMKEEKYYKNGTLAFSEMVTMLSKDEVRNSLIVQQIQWLLSIRSKLIVVSSLVQHCLVLRKCISAACPDIKLACMAGKYKEPELAKDPSVRIVFATYSLLEEGYDDPDLDSLVLCTPRSRIQQTIGRVERVKEGKLVPIVVDIADGFSIYDAMWYKRKHFYTSRAFEILT